MSDARALEALARAAARYAAEPRGRAFAGALAAEALPGELFDQAAAAACRGAAILVSADVTDGEGLLRVDGFLPGAIGRAQARRAVLEAALACAELLRRLDAADAHGERPGARV